MSAEKCRSASDLSEKSRLRLELPRTVQEILRRLADHGFEAYAVGGCVRDLLIGRKPGDWDITTSARPEEVKTLFSRTVDTGLKHGTVTVMIDHVGYEVTTYRIDGSYEDFRHPSEVTFTGDLAEDLRRRDFTINAMAYNDEAGLVDLFDGAGDLRRGVIRCVGLAQNRFMEDALRMLRALRFAAQLGFAVEDGTAEAIRELAPNLARVSAERIQTELVKLLVSDHPEVLRQVWRLGLSKVFLPELDRMMETPQNTPHHCYDVGEHTIRSVCGIRSDRILRLAMLLHDVAKPDCRRTDENGRDHFHGHPVMGAQMAEEILRRLRFDNASIGRVRRLVLFHDERPEAQERSVRRFISRSGPDLFPDLFEVKRADTLAQSTYRRSEKLAALDAYERIYQKIAQEEQCLTRGMLAVNGKDLIDAGMKPGRELGEVLDRLFSHVLDHPEDNEKERLLGLLESCGEPEGAQKTRF